MPRSYFSCYSSLVSIIDLISDIEEVGLFEGGVVEASSVNRGEIVDQIFLFFGFAGEFVSAFPSFRNEKVGEILCDLKDRLPANREMGK